MLIRTVDIVTQIRSWCNIVKSLCQLGLQSPASHHVVTSHSRKLNNALKRRCYLFSSLSRRLAGPFTSQPSTFQPLSSLEQSGLHIINPSLNTKTSFHHHQANSYHSSLATCTRSSYSSQWSKAFHCCRTSRSPARRQFRSWSPGYTLYTHQVE